MPMKRLELPPYDYQPKSYRGTSYEEVLRLKNRYVTPTSIPHYRKPLMIVGGSMQYIFNPIGRQYLDVIGEIVTISVGHCRTDMVWKRKVKVPQPALFPSQIGLFKSYLPISISYVCPSHPSPLSLTILNRTDRANQKPDNSICSCRYC
jgi:hypothetical protein